ncbi:pyridoxal-phosphate dependent enzyme [Streptomyces sp. NPDC002540]
MPRVEPVLERALRRTPLLHLDVAHRGRTRRLGLKLEESGPTGSVKDRSAVELLQALHDERPFTPGTVVVESTSGNLGLALARLLPSIDCVFLAVVDLKTPHATRRTLTASPAIGSGLPASCDSACGVVVSHRRSASIPSFALQSKSHDAAR